MKVSESTINYIQELPCEILEKIFSCLDLPSLRAVNKVCNLWNQISLPQLWKAFAEKTKITFGLQRRGLTVLSSGIGYFTEIEMLNLSRNRLKILPPEIGNLTKLKGLHLSFNLLKSLPHQITQLINLAFLHISDNKFTSIPQEISNLTTLRYLTFCNNPIEDKSQTKELEKVLPNCNIIT